jgi:hypothetical protein
LPGLGTYTFPDPVAKTATMSLKVGIDDDGNLWAESDKDNAPMFGVSGVGGSSSTLTRLWDSVGKTSTPGTDTVQAKSDFDMYEPFCRRKCVGTWAIDGDKAKFTVAAYYGDADYTEDGSMGDYVAVEINPLWWYESEDKSIIGVSGSPHPGWEPHPVCVAADGTPREKTYLPVYALALKDGHAVSLPGYQNEFGSYKSMWDKARTYGDGSLKNAAIIEPSVVDHYEWLLETIEFATQNCQTVMTGATSMRYAEDVITAAPAANQLVVTDTIGKQLVVGQTIYVTSNYQWTPSNISAYNVITAISACTEDGTLDASGSYRLITYNGTDRTSSITAGTTQIVSRPWITGATQGYAPGVNAVLGHTGSPVSNTNWKYPMMYRWRENTYGNQYMTALDLMDERVAVDDSYKIRWWYNPDLQHNGATKYYPADNNKPDTTDLNKESNGWITLSVETPTASYVNGYIKEEGADERHPCIRVPINTVGGSATSYICDFASLVDSYVVRAVRRRGHVASGSAAGPRLVSAYFSPAYGYWYSGAGLFMTQ